MVINILMLLAMYPMMMIVCFVMYTSMKPKNGLAFGCAVSAERMRDESLKEIERQWSMEMKRNICITALLPALAFFTPYVSIQIMIWSMWVLVLIALLEIPFIKANAKVKDVKRSMGWYDPKKPEEYIELKAAGEVRRVKKITFFVPTILSFAAAAAVYSLAMSENEIVKHAGYVKDFGIVIAIFALINFLFIGAALWMDAQKTEVISTQSDVNINYTRAKKNIWKDFWLQTVWITTGYVWLCAIALVFALRFDLVVLAGCVVYSIAVLLLIFPVIKKLRAVDKHYESERDIIFDGDDDRYWILGMFYNNPSDKHTMVSARNGMGTTINMATGAGKAWWIVTAIALLSIPILCGWVIFEEFTPISLSIIEDEVHANHVKTEHEIAIAEIENLEMIYDLPKLTKSVGEAMDTLAKGKFRVKETGERCILFLNPENGCFLRFEWDGQIYYMSGATDEETRMIYEGIKEGNGY